MPKGVYTRKPFTVEHRSNMSKSKIGHIVSPSTREKIGIANKGRERLDVTGENHKAWKGADVSYSGLHHWVVRKLGKPTVCEHCGKGGLKGRAIDWANKSHKYYRRLDDWIRLCKSCHKAYDNQYKQQQIK